MPSRHSVSRRIFVMGSLGGALAAGCGSAPPTASSPPVGRGAAQFTIVWPEPKPPSRLIPAAAQSIKIVLSGPTTATKTVARPPVGTNQTTITFPDLEIGSYTATATAYPTATATGVAQATGSLSLTITKNQTTTESLTMGSTIERLELSPLDFLLAPTESRTFTLTARDSSNNSVLLGPSLTTTVGNSLLLKITPSTTNTFLIEGLKPGTTAIRFLETESGKELSQDFKITYGNGDGLAESPWATFGCNQYNTRRSSWISKPTKRLWNQSLGNYINAMVIDNDGNIIFNHNNDDTLYALSPSGGLKWKTKLTNKTINSAPCVDIDGNIYQTTVQGTSSEGYVGPCYLHSLSSLGSIQWALPLRFSTPSGTKNFSAQYVNVGPDKTVYITCNSTTTPNYWGLIALSPGGSIQWSYIEAGFVGETVGVHQKGFLVVHTSAVNGETGKLLAFNSDGTVRWNTSFQGTSNPVILSDGSILARTLSATKCFSEAGIERWSRLLTMDWFYVVNDQGIIGKSSSANFITEITTYDSVKNESYSLFSGSTQQYSIGLAFCDRYGNFFLSDFYTGLYSYTYKGVRNWQYSGDGNIGGLAIPGPNGIVYIASSVFISAYG